MNSKYTVLIILTLAAVSLYIIFPDSGLVKSNVKDEHDTNVTTTDTTEASQQGQKLMYQNLTETPVLQFEAAGELLGSESEKPIFQISENADSKIETANKYFNSISKLASEKDWDKLIELAYILQSEKSELVGMLFLEAAKNDAPEYLFTMLSNIGVSLPKNAVQYLIGTSSIETLELLTVKFGLDLDHTNTISGNAFSHAATTDANIDVFDFLISSGATLEESGRFEPVQELIVKTIISGDNNEIVKIKKLIDYGAHLTAEHYEYASKYRNYRPALYSLIDSYYTRQNRENGD